MGKQVFNIKGMMRDLDPAKTPNQYAYEIRNLRLTAQEDSTMLALVSEKGNAQYQIVDYEGDPAIIQGVIIGYCVLHNYLTIFTHDENDPKTPDRIYRLEMDSTIMTSLLLYAGDLGFGEDGVNIEAIGIYENQNLQKVYWIDGVHQPRFINIMADATTMGSWQSDGSSFDFVPRINMDELVEVEKSTYNGVFNSGTIQYVLTYYNRNGQQTAAFYQSPINYIAPNSKGASPEDTVSNSFCIKILNPDTTFDYVRIYSVFRSSENGTFVCKKVKDIKTEDTRAESRNGKFRISSLGTETSVDYYGPLYPTAFEYYVVDSNYRIFSFEDFLQYKEGNIAYYNIGSDYSIITVSTSSPNTIARVQAASGESMSVWRDNNGLLGINRSGDVGLRKWENVTAVIEQDNINYLEYIDNGLSGEVVDYSEILYAGGANIIPSTMAQKSQTLFFGNYTETPSISEEDINTIVENSHIHFGYSEDSIEKGNTGSYYMYHNQLDGDAKKITTFKGGETYYFGIILQDEYGTWTNVIPIGSKRNPYYPKDRNVVSMDAFYTVKAYISFDAPALSIINNYKAVKVLRLDTIPSIACQGVLCPTVFNHKRESNSPYCMSSWFFRDIGMGKMDAAHKVQNLHNGLIIETADDLARSEVQGAKTIAYNYYGADDHPEWSDMDMFVDWNTLTFHSPDIEFGQQANMNYKMRIVGITPITSGRTSMILSWSTPPRSNRVTEHFDYSPIVHNTPDTYAYELDLNSFVFRDSYTGPNDITSLYLYPVYPWHRNASLTGQGTPTEDGEWWALLDLKVMASLRESATTKYKEGPVYPITNMKVYQDDETSLLLEEDTNNWLFNGAKVYSGSMDTILTNSNGYSTYGKLDSAGSSVTIINSNVKDSVRMKYKSTKHGVFSLKSSHNQIFILPNVSMGADEQPAQGGIGQIAPKATIKAKLTPTNITQNNGLYTISGNIDTTLLNVDDIVMLDGQRYLFYVYRIINPTSMIVNILEGGNLIGGSQDGELDMEWLTRHPGGDKTNETHSHYPNGQGTDDYGCYWNDYSYKSYFVYYDSATHNIEYYSITITEGEGKSDEGLGEPIYMRELGISTYKSAGTITGDGAPQIVQDEYDISDINSGMYSYMYMAELYTNDLSFNPEDAPWYVASEPIKTGRTCFVASIGDTYYQRYDCLKTYPFALEDQNQIIEIFSFMCETRINIDGRYDNRRGMADNTSVTATNFNLLNRAYTQNDNFFTYHYIDPSYFNVNKFPNQIIWTGTKVYGSDIDAWTHIPPTSTLDMDGSLGEVRALRLWNDNLICFQDMGIAKIMYNERTTMTTQQGVPVEIANSGKVDGSHYISNTIGCRNKNSIQITQEGIYFVDSSKREFYKWSQGLEALSKTKGFNTYFYNDSLNIDNIKTFYDSKLRDVYIRTERADGNTTRTECLVYNEQLGEFTSFFDYDMDFMFNYKNSLVSVEHNSGNLWKQFAGDYLRYFNRLDGQEPFYEYYIVNLVSAENPTMDKTFTNVEFRADVLRDSITKYGSQDYDSDPTMLNLASINKLPFKTLRVWNEYQNTGDIEFDRLLRRSTNLSQKFRIWRGDIGRDVMDKLHKFNRIRSPWARLRLVGGGEKEKTVIHDIAVMYV